MDHLRRTSIYQKICQTVLFIFPWNKPHWLLMNKIKQLLHNSRLCNIEIREQKHYQYQKWMLSESVVYYNWICHSNNSVISIIQVNGFIYYRLQFENHCRSCFHLILWWKLFYMWNYKHIHYWWQAAITPVFGVNLFLSLDFFININSLFCFIFLWKKIETK